MGGLEGAMGMKPNEELEQLRKWIEGSDELADQIDSLCTGRPVALVAFALMRCSIKVMNVAGKTPEEWAEDIETLSAEIFARCHQTDEGT